MAGLFDIISELIKSRKDKKDNSIIVKNYISGNNNQNNSVRKKRTNNTKKINHENSNKTTPSSSQIVLQAIRIYCTGAKGKVYTTTFHKSLTHNFGIEVKIKNYTSKIQKVKLGHCIYDESGKNTMFKSNFYPKINPNSTLTENIYVDANAFRRMKPGKYKSQFWINNKKVQKVFFTIKNK